MESTLSVRLGKLIRELRLNRGWRQIDLAAHAELSRGHICDIERGKREVGIDTLGRLAVALDRKPSELLGLIGS